MKKVSWRSLTGSHLPSAWYIKRLPLAFDAFEEDVLIVAHDHGHAPGQLAVVAGYHCRHAGQGDACRLIFGERICTKFHSDGNAQWQVGVIGQQAFAATAALGQRLPSCSRRRRRAYVVSAICAAVREFACRPGN
jgi:hypothetical protein